jgi:hypothetical protein
MDTNRPKCPPQDTPLTPASQLRNVSRCRSQIIIPKTRDGNSHSYCPHTSKASPKRNSDIYTSLNIRNNLSHTLLSFSAEFSHLSPPSISPVWSQFPKNTLDFSFTPPQTSLSASGASTISSESRLRNSVPVSLSNVAWN